MEVRVAKEYLHIRDWLALAQEIVDEGQQAYLGTPLSQEAGDSIMMKVGEAAGRLARAGMEPPPGVEWSDAIANRKSQLGHPPIRRNRQIDHLEHPQPRHSGLENGLGPTV